MVKTLRQRPADDQGFTLVEMLVVILILGVISSISIIAIGGVRRTSTVQACSTDWQTFDTALKTYGLDHLSPTSGLPDYSGLSSNALQVLATGDPKYLSNPSVSDPNRYQMSVSATASGYTIQVSNRLGGNATALTDAATPAMAATACSTAVGL